MGYFSLDIKKAKGTSDTTQSDHIERKIIPKNADPTRTHLNRVLVEYPDGVHGRDEAIAHRLNTAGIKRKITHDQVRVVRVVLSGTHEDMMDIQENGRLDEWCSDSIQWLQATFGRENVVAAHLHMDEKTPHIHAAIVPIVTGERRKAKKEQTDGKRKYRKKTNSVRLCADDLFNRQTLVAYHDNYARVMTKYGLQRGVRGSEARHTTTMQYYRDLKKKNEVLETETRLLQEKKAEAQEELKQVKAEIRTDKLKNAATDTATALASSVGSLFGSGKLKELEQANEKLRQEVVKRNKGIDELKAKMQQMQEQHGKQIRNLQGIHNQELETKDREISRLNTILEKAFNWFPLLKEMLRMEKLCYAIGFTKDMVNSLLTKKEAIRCNGKIYSEEHRRRFEIKNDIFKVEKNPTDNRKLILTINKQPIGEWFKEQWEKLRHGLRQSAEEPRKSRGFRM